MESSLVLLVDNDSALQAMYGRRLRADGFEVIPAADGTEALAATAQPLKLILLDFRMPGMSGLEVLHRLKGDKATAHVPVVMLSNESDPETTAACRAGGALAWWSKQDLTPAELSRRVRVLLDEAAAVPATTLRSRAPRDGVCMDSGSG